MTDCTCPKPKHDGRGEKCQRCGGFACDYAPPGRTRCYPAICDCFIEQFPDSPFGLHPEAFYVGPVRGTRCGLPGCADPTCTLIPTNPKEGDL